MDKLACFQYSDKLSITYLIVPGNDMTAEAEILLVFGSDTTAEAEILPVFGSDMNAEIPLRKSFLSMTPS